MPSPAKTTPTLYRANAVATSATIVNKTSIGSEVLFQPSVDIECSTRRRLLRCVDASRQIETSWRHESTADHVPSITVPMRAEGMAEISDGELPLLYRDNAVARSSRYPNSVPDRTRSLMLHCCGGGRCRLFVS